MSTRRASAKSSLRRPRRQASQTLLPVAEWSGGSGSAGGTGGTLRIIDQTLLPERYVRLRLTRLEEVGEAIRSLRVRGAPTIGIAAAYGLCVGLKEAARGRDTAAFLAEMDRAARFLIESRPTAVNLAWAVRRLVDVARGEAAALAETARPKANPSPRTLWWRLLKEARAIHREEIERNEAIGRHGAEIINRPGMNVLTHCNTGSLATGGIGTALGVVFAAAARGLDPHVWVDETRPLLQGARLTTWELQRQGVRATLICDNMAAMLMAEGRVDVALVGADRIARNGDFANKIGTYSVAVNCRHHGVPFYCVAPLSTFDPAIPNGRAIPIEHRAADEVRGFRDARWAPPGVPCFNPSFDVTPARLLAGIVTERGIARPPLRRALSAWGG